jgi:hypothetical protein
MPQTLASAREEFIKFMYRDNAGVERPRLVAVLDALIAWSTTRASQVRFRPDEKTNGAICFESIATNSVLLTLTPRRENVPLLHLLPGASRVLTDEERSEFVARLNTYTREANPLGRMHIGFGALKNPAGREAVFALMDEVLLKMQPAHAAAAKAS